MITIVRPEGFPGLEMQSGIGVHGDVPRHWHEEYQLCAVVRGYGEMRHGRTVYPNPPGTLNMVAPGEVHSNATSGSTTCDFLKLDFDPALLASAAVQLRASVLQPAFSVPSLSHPDTFQRFLGLYRTFSQPACGLARESLLLEFFAVLLRRHMRTRAALPALGSETRAVRVVREHLRENYAAKIALDQLSRLAGLSPFHLTRVFARDTGLPPHAFLNQVRIARAKVLLRSGLPIARVAAETGFSDQSHLTRAFKHVVRVSPGVYRE